ncbi:hypothetical protein NCC49_003538 [Naganishia albida]|nr:hypothetical protein NCC49_003538 [Naganishia albida]
MTVEGVVEDMVDEGVVLEMTDEEMALEREVASDRESVLGKVTGTDNEVAREADAEATLLELLVEAFDVTGFAELAWVVLAIDEALELVEADEETGRDDVRTVVDEDTAAEDDRSVEAVLTLESAEEDATDEAAIDEEETAEDELDATLDARLVDEEVVTELAAWEVLDAMEDEARLDD